MIDARGQTSPRGRFVYASYSSAERRKERFDDMRAEGEISLCEAAFEDIRDHNGRIVAYAVTIE